jgi:FMN phosphatase YigB (HAD superfamily)
MINNESRRVIVTDMDGTLYRLNSPGNKYAGSTLEATVLCSARYFLIEQNFCDASQVDTVIQEGLADPIGLSAYVQRTYGVTRKEYFDNVWNINPEGMLTDYQEAVQTLRELALSSTLILLTAAGRAWQQQVCQYLGIADLFAKVYTAEDFGQKGEVFEKLIKTYPKENMTSVGDQEESDILPAKKLGIKTILVREPKEMTKLLEVA